MNIKYLPFLSIAFVISLVACSAYTDYRDSSPPDTNIDRPVPEAWQSDATGPGWNIFRDGWLSTFSDSRLEEIVNEALEYNYDIQIAAARVDSARAAAKKAGAALLPAINMNLGANESGNAAGDPSTSNFGASLDVSWELDVWGRIQAGEDAATNTFVASQADFYYARQSLAAQVVKAYFLGIEAANQERYAQTVYDNYEKSLEVTEAFFEQGLVPIQNVHLAKAELLRSEDALENAKSSKVQALRSLELLLGQYPAGKFEIANQLPGLPAPVPAGAPSEMLERRPDLFAAERRVAAAFNRTMQAKAARLPRLSLTSSTGGSSGELSDITDPANIFWNVASNLVTPLFDGGGREADVEIATAEQAEAVATYKKAALAAFGDVESALFDEQVLKRRLTALQGAKEQAELAEDIARAKYERGEGKLLDIQQMQRAVVSANIEALRVEQALHAERVNLYLALGADFSGRE